MTEIEAKAMVEKIVTDLTDRRGLSGEWYQIDDATRDEIVEAWGAIAAAALRSERERALRDAAQIVITCPVNVGSERSDASAAILALIEKPDV